MLSLNQLFNRCTLKQEFLIFATFGKFDNKRINCCYIKGNKKEIEKKLKNIRLSLSANDFEVNSIKGTNNSVIKLSVVCYQEIRLPDEVIRFN